MIIKGISASKILNSAGNWTIECHLKNDGGQIFIASTPAGISTGGDEKEPAEIKTAIEQIKREIAPKVLGKDLNQESLDSILEFGNWGSNTTLAVSAAFFKSRKIKKNKKRPKLMMLIFEGEKHGNPNLTIQEFMVIFNSLNKGVTFFKKIQKILTQKGIVPNVGAEGGFSPLEFKDKNILDLLKQSGAKKIALDVAGNENPPEVSQMIEIIKNYPISSIEDPFEEQNPKKWQSFYQKALKINPNLIIIGDDLTVTDDQKIEKYANKLINGVIIKPNQQGTITAASKAILKAKKLGLKTIASHRGEETNDNWIADFAIENQVDFVKFGGPSKGERISKYNRLQELF